MPSSCLSVNSSNRTASSTSSADYTVNLPRSVPCGRKARLINVNLPNTLYKIRTGVNNKLDLNDGAPRALTIPPGAYSMASLCAAILAQLQIVSTNFTAVSYNPDTMNVAITRSVGAYTLLFASGPNAATSIRKEIGFTAADLAGSLTYTGTLAAGLPNPLSLYMVISTQPAGMSQSGLTSSGIPFTFQLPISVNSAGVLSFTSGSYYYQTADFGGAAGASACVAQLTVRLIYVTGEVVNLNGSDWDFLVELET